MATIAKPARDLLERLRRRDAVVNGTYRAAFGAVRVMTNTNQTGEAAGVAAALALDTRAPVWRVDPAALRRALADGGSIVL